MSPILVDGMLLKGWHKGAPSDLVSLQSDNNLTEQEWKHMAGYKLALGVTQKRIYSVLGLFAPYTYLQS